MIGTLNSAQSYIELKDYLKAFNETKKRVDANPNDFKHYFGGNDFDPNSIMAINTIMANERARKKPQAEYEKLSACVTFSNAITGNNSNDASKLATLNDVDCSYYCFSKELGEVIDKRSVSGGKKLKHPEEFSTNLIANAQKDLESKEEEVKNAKKATSKARRKLAGKRMIFLLSFLPSIAVLFATGFAAYAGISWLAVQTLTFSPVVLGIAFLPAIGGLALTNVLLKKVIERAAKNVGKAKGEVTACKQNEKKAERDRKKSFEEYASLYKHANKILKGYTYEPTFNSYLGEEALKARAEEAKNSKGAETNPEKPKTESSQQVEQKPTISSQPENNPNNISTQPSQENQIQNERVLNQTDLVQSNTKVEEENLQDILNSVKNNQELDTKTNPNPEKTEKEKVEEETPEQKNNDDEKGNKDIEDEMASWLDSGDTGLEDDEQTLVKEKEDNLNNTNNSVIDNKSKAESNNNNSISSSKNNNVFDLPDEDFTYEKWLKEEAKTQEVPELSNDELDNVDNLFKQRNLNTQTSSEREDEKQEMRKALNSYFDNANESNLTENDIELADNMFKEIKIKSAKAGSTNNEKIDSNENVQTQQDSAIWNKISNETKNDEIKNIESERDGATPHILNNKSSLKQDDDNYDIKDANFDSINKANNESVAVVPYSKQQTAVVKQEKPKNLAGKRKISIKDLINSQSARQQVEDIRSEKPDKVSINTKNSEEHNENTALVPTRKLLTERAKQYEQLNNTDKTQETTEDYDNLDTDRIEEIEPEVKQNSIVLRPENSTSLIKTNYANRPKVIKNATKLKKQEEEQKRQEANERLELESQDLSRKEMFDSMNLALEDDYAGDFSEIVPADFMNLEQHVDEQYEQAKELKRQGSVSPQEKEFVARAEYEKAVCDYYGRFVPRTYTDGRIIKPVDYTLNYTPNENLGYDDLKKKKSILNYKQKAFKALVELGRVSLENKGAEQDVIETGIAVFNNQIDLAKERSQEVEREIEKRNRAIMANVANSISVAMGTKSKSVRFNTKERKIAEDTVHQLLTDNLKEYGKKKYLAKSMSAKREALESEIEYLRDCDAKISAFSIFKQLNYKTSEELRYNLVLTDANSRTLENLEVLFKSKGVGNTPKSKVVHEQLEMTRNVEAYEEAKAEQNARDNEISSLGKLYDKALSQDEKQSIRKRIEQTQLKNAQENSDFENLKLIANEDALKQMQIISNFHGKKIKAERVSVARDENVSEVRKEKLDEAQQLYAEINNSVNFTEQDYISIGQDRLAVLENLKKKAMNIDELIKTANSKRFEDKLKRKDLTDEYKQMLLSRFKNMTRKQKNTENEINNPITQGLEQDTDNEQEMER